MEWVEDNTILLMEAGHIGVTADPRELTDLITAQGWQLDKVQWAKDSFIAKASTPDGEKAEATGPAAADALANLLLRINNYNHLRSYASRLAAMNTDWLSLGTRMQEIAQVYAKAPMYEIKAGLAWQELANDSRRRSEEISNQITIEVVDNPHPYTDASKMYEDVRKKRHLFVSRADINHPLWSTDDVIHFRICHWVLGYVATDASFGWQGEVMACAAHAQYLSSNAQRALLSDRIGQMAFGFYYGTFIPKISFLKEIEESIGLEEGQDSWGGIHPSQTVVPDFHADFNRTSAYVADPNANWSPQELGVQPMATNAYQWGGDPLDAEKPGGMMDTANKVNSGWSNFRKADGTDDFDRMKQAIFNALKVVLLSPRKELQGNAIHYQDVSDVFSDDPMAYQNRLEARREQWNQARGYAPGSHKAYWKEQQKFYSYIQHLHPEMTPDQAREEADREWFNIWNDIEEEIENDPKNADKTSYQIDYKVGNEIKKRVQRILKPDINEDTDVADNQLSMFGGASDKATSDIWGQDPNKYIAWLGGQSKAMAAAYTHIDELTKAALEDVRERGGTGHHFRSTLLGLGIPGVGPKVASFAWLLLQPTSSQLATMDTHMLDLMGADPKDAKMRDYYRLERELAARRDAAGYGHVPLGAFQWGMWDAKRTGIGTHQDHSAMKPVDPMPHNLIDWNAKAGTNDAGYDLDNDPEWQWWRDTEPAAQAVREDWSKNIAPNYKDSQIPGPAVEPMQAFSAIEEEMLAPWHINDAGDMISGSPGQTIMDHLRGTYKWTPEQVWQSEYEVGKQ